MIRNGAVFLGAILLTATFNMPSSAGVIYQRFEPDHHDTLNTWAVGTAGVGLVDRREAVHLGVNAIKTNSSFYWTGFGVTSQVSPGDTDLKETNNDRLTFWIYSLPQRACYIYGCETGSENTVGVVFYDHGLYAANGFEVWTSEKSAYQKWSKMRILFSQLPPDFDLRHVSKIEFKNFLPGRYYFDDIHAVREDRVYESFNQERHGGTSNGDFGWKWLDADSAVLSAPGEPVLEGSHSWKLISTQKWGGTGIQSEQQNYFLNDQQKVEQSFWHTNLYPQNNDRLSFWVYALPENGMDNNLNVQFYDHGVHATDATKVEAWTKKAAQYGKWTRLEILFRDLPADLNLADLDKIQFQHYWKGTYYLDDIRATGTHPLIKENALPQGVVSWDAIPGAQNYRLMQSNGPNGQWVTIYSGPLTSFKVTRLTKTWFKVRWEEAFSGPVSLPYSSPWSDAAEYTPPAVVLKYSALYNGQLTWNTIPQSPVYELESATQVTGPWIQVYKGPVPLSPLSATTGKWYRVRAITESNGAVTDFGAWSRPLLYSPGTTFVKASGTVLKDRNGLGNEIVLKGVNLGNYLLTEDWMTGFGREDTPPIPDDWSLREVLISRFGATGAENLLRAFQNAYLNDFDFDRLAEDNVTLVRLPVYYRNIMDDSGNFIRNAQGQIDFAQIDRVVNAMSDRGIYTLIDLHGAPGAQSAEFHTGRKNFNKLFEDSPEGETYRGQTETLWREIARHYMANPWVLGYDLLNEPVGAAPNNAALADLYDRLYDTIRAIDPNHLIVMEGIWYADPSDPEPNPNKKRSIVDWDTLPVPSSKGWINVMYQFHFYHWNDVDANGNAVNTDADFSSHKAYMDTKVAEASVKQALYNVPLMVGEFYGFDLKEIWDYYLLAFKANKWSWTSWSYKYQSSPSNWGEYSNANYDEILPKFRAVQADGTPGDSYAALSAKLSKYTTQDYHAPNVTLREILHPPVGDSTGVGTGVQSSVLAANVGTQVLPDGSFAIVRPGLCDTPGTVQFVPFWCNDLPQGSIACNNGDAAITFWSDSMIKGFGPPDYSPGSFGGAQVHCSYGGELYPTMIINNLPPVLDAVSNQAVLEGQFLSFNISGTDPDGDALYYSAANVPAGAYFIGQTFTWTPLVGQAGTYNVTFKVSDGIVTDEQTITLTVAPAQLADLRLMAISTTAQSITPGTGVSLKTTVKNIGTVAAVASLTKFHLSIDPNYGGADDIVLAATRAVGSVNVGASKTSFTTVTIPLGTAQGNYYVCAKADGASAVVELNETNNSLCAANPIMIRLPDLVVTALNGPVSGVAGSAVMLTDSIKNQGQGGSNSFRVGYYLSVDPVITTMDTRVGARFLNSLAIGASDSGVVMVILPVRFKPGTYYWGAIADYKNTRPEANESNNAKTGNAVVL